MTEPVQTEQEPSPSCGHNLKETMMDLEPKRSSSPSDSQISARTDHSMDHPANFKGEPLSELVTGLPQCGSLDSDPKRHVKRGHDESPPHPSKHMKTSRKLQFTNDQEDAVAESGESDRSSSPSFSQGSDDSGKSRGQIENFNREPDISKSELATELLTNDELKCSICNEMFTNPVNTPCGHSFCKVCINSDWQQPDQEGLYKCPHLQCPMKYSTRPELYPNGVVNQLLKRAIYSPVLPAPSYARPGEVACDICRPRKRRAVKFCVTCTAKYCEIHIRDHYNVPALQKHQCKEATEEPPTSSSSPESIPTDKAKALHSYNVDVSPLAGSKCPQMMTPPKGTSQCGSLDSDLKRPVKRGHDESPPHPSKHMKTTVRKLQFTND